MKRKDFIKGMIAAGILSPSLLRSQVGDQSEGKDGDDYIHFLRHATLFVKIGNKKILVDPMFSEMDAMDPVPNSLVQKRIPMVELPVTTERLMKELEETDAVVVTHLHRDHWDEAAGNLIQKNKLILCQEVDLETIKSQGFTRVHTFEEYKLPDLELIAIGGRHGTGEIGAAMGKVSGVVIKSEKRTLYIAGDTIWCSEVDDALAKHHPHFVVVNAGAAQFLQGAPITMTKEDVQATIQHGSSPIVIAVHMDTVNHCGLKKTDLKIFLAHEVKSKKLVVPADGQIISLS
jgi:L-ascorbate metabolism protein UlaG (beta-lactamase superfamily)